MSSMTFQELLPFVNDVLKDNPHLKDKPALVTDGGEITGWAVMSDGSFRLKQEIEFAVSEYSSWNKFNEVFEAAGVPVLEVRELANCYYPASYMKLRAENPWWMVKTPRGYITIGWRKRVISISWDFAQVIVTEDDTTKEDTMVHAWTFEKATEYLQALWKATE